MHLPELPPEALTVIMIAAAAITLAITSGLVKKFRRLKIKESVWTTYYGLDGQPFEAEITELNPRETPWL